jgi:hypothetical protein
LEVRFVFRFFLCSYNCCILFFLFIFDISMYMANWFR